MRIHHVAFRTSDLSRLEQFYVGLLGLSVTDRHGDRSVWIDAGGSILMLEVKGAAEPDIQPGTRELVAFRVDPGSVADLRKRLAAAGVGVEDATKFTLYVRDPDGRRVGLSAFPDELG